MTEIAARLPRSRASLLALQLLVLLTGLAFVTVGVLALRPHPRSQAAAPAATPGTKRGAAARIALARAAAEQVAADRDAVALGIDAARGFDRSFFLTGPSETAAQVAQWHPLLVRAARGSGISPALLEGLVYVESSGRADAIGGGGAAGLTQLHAGLARRLGLRVNVARSDALTRAIDRTWHATHARQLRRWRSRYDERFAPAKALGATVRYLVALRRAFGRADLAVAAYHLGVGELRRAIAASGLGSEPTYAQLYFGSSPDRHAAVWRLLAGDGDYYWKVLAAQHVMRLYRQPGALAYEAALQAKKNSAEEVMHPRTRTLRFATPAAIARAWQHHILRAIPRDPGRTHIAISGFLGQEARALGRSRRLYTGLRPAALDVLLYIGKRVHELSGAPKLLVTSAVRDNRYQRILMRVNANAARTYSMHTTGYAFDIARSYSSARQAAAFQFVLDRLAAVGAIAYIHEYSAIHVAVASDAPARLRLLATAATPASLSSPALR